MKAAIVSFKAIQQNNMKLCPGEYIAALGASQEKDDLERAERYLKRAKARVENCRKKLAQAEEKSRLLIEEGLVTPVED